jgi:tetratricopeptide (TPR) repeat protein
MFGFIAVFGILVLASRLTSTFARKFTTSSLAKKLETANRRTATLEFIKEGRLLPQYVGIVRQGCPGLAVGSRLVFDLLKRPEPALFTEPARSVDLYFDASNRPFLVTSGQNAFLLNNGWLAHNPQWRVVSLGAGFVMVPLLIVVLAVVLAGNGIGVPPKIVPAGLTADRYYELGVEYKTVGWTEQARESLQKAINLGAGKQIAATAQRYLSTKLPRYPVADEAVSMNIQGYNLDSPVSHEAAEKVWLECIKKYPNFEWPYSNLGAAYVEQGKYQKGEVLLHKALEINPSYVNAWLHLADSKRKQRDFNEARKCINKALELDPTDQSARIMSLLPDF